MTERIRRQLGIVVAALVVTSGLGTAQTAKPDPMNGVWKLDPAKATFSPGPGPKSLTATIEQTAETRKIRIDGIAGDGTASRWGYTGKFDGSEIPVSGSMPDADAVVLKRLSPTSTEALYKKAGKATLTTKVTVSSDGKTLLVETTGTNAEGQKVSQRYTLVKQTGA